jgi:hypothetical protein
MFLSHVQKLRAEIRSFLSSSIELLKAVQEHLETCTLLTCGGDAYLGPTVKCG